MKPGWNMGAYLNSTAIIVMCLVSIHVKLAIPPDLCKTQYVKSSRAAGFGHHFPQNRLFTPHITGFTQVFPLK